MSGNLDKAQPKIIENIITQDLSQIPDDILKSIGISKEDKLEIVQIVEKYNTRNSKNLIGLSSFLKLMIKKYFQKGIFY